MIYESQLKSRLAAMVAGSPAAAIIQQLEARPDLPALAHSTDTPWNLSLSQTISTVSPEALCGGTATNQEAAKAFKSGLLLWNDDLDASHTLSQGVHTATGSYWHGIMHRREPDYSNSKYWFRMTGEHATFGDLREIAVAVATQTGLEALARSIASQYEWNPERFVDWCEASAAGAEAPPASFLATVQLEEIRLLLIYSLEQAKGL